MRLFKLSLAFLVGQAAAAAAGTSAASSMNVRLVGSGQARPPNNSTRPLITRQAPVTSGGIGKTGTPVDEITVAKTAILYKGDDQTYCEVMMSSQTIGIAAASCFDYVNNEVDPNVSYTVAVSVGTTSSATGGVYKATKVTPHPNYDPETYANNIAVMQFTAVAGFEFTKQIADWPDEWTQYYFVHRSLTNVMPFVFNNPQVSAVDVGGDNSGCTDASAIYKANTGDYVCSMLTVQSYINSNCVAPYGSVYGVANPNPAELGALFSHSAIYGTDGYCGKGPIYNYYLILRNYIPWIHSIAQTDISTYHIDSSSSYTAANDASYVMKTPAAEKTGVAVVGNYTTNAIVPAVKLEPVQSRISADSGVLMSEASEKVIITEITTDVTTDIVSSTYIASSTEIDSTTATISKTTTLETTDIISQTSVVETTSTILITSTTVELSVMTLTATEVVPTAIGATNSIISPVIVYVTDVSILTVGNGDIATQTVTSTDTVTVSAGNAGVVTVGGETMTVTETVTAATNTVYVTSVVTESASAVTSVSTATFTDYDFITVYTTDTSVSTVTVVSTGSIGTPTSVTSPSSIQPSSAASEPSSAESSGSDADSQKDDKGVPMWMIAMIAILGILFLILLVWFILYRRRRQREKEQAEMISFGAPMQLPRKYRVINWLNEKVWGRPPSRVEPPPEYMTQGY